MAFYGGVLNLALAQLVPDRKVGFYWLGGPGMSMLGRWEVGTTPQHVPDELRPELGVIGWKR